MGEGASCLLPRELFAADRSRHSTFHGLGVQMAEASPNGSTPASAGAEVSQRGTLA